MASERVGTALISFGPFVSSPSRARLLLWSLELLPHVFFSSVSKYVCIDVHAYLTKARLGGGKDVKLVESAAENALYVRGAGEENASISMYY